MFPSRFDCRLTRHDHIDYICGKISKNVNIIVKLKHYVSKATLIGVYYSLIYPYLPYAFGSLAKSLSSSIQIVKLQNEAVRVINDVPSIESITPHYTSLTRPLKFSDIVKLNTCMLFMIISTVKRFLIYLFHWYLSYTVTVPAVHHPTELQYPHFELIFGNFAPAIIGSSFGMIFRNLLGTNHREKCSEKHFYAGTLPNTNDTLSLL